MQQTQSFHRVVVGHIFDLSIHFLTLYLRLKIKCLRSLDKKSRNKGIFLSK